MTNTSTQTKTTHTFDLKGGDVILIDGQPREFFDSYKHQGQFRVVEYVDAEGSIRRVKGDSFERVV